MKRSLLLLFLSGFSFWSVSQAQIKKGATFLGGDISGGKMETKSDGAVFEEVNQFRISPVFGKAIRDNLILGVDLIYSSGSNSNSGTDTKSRIYGGGVFIRKYKPLGTSGFAVFAQGRLGVNANKVESGSPVYWSDVRKGFDINLGAYPGLSYAVSKKLQLESGFSNFLAVTYMSDKRTIDQGSAPVQQFKTRGFSVSSSLNNISALYLGFRVLLN